MAGMFINGEDLPRADNRITLNSNVKDAYGLPVPHVHVDEHANDQAMRKQAQGQMSKMYEEIGANVLSPARLRPLRTIFARRE